MKYINSRQQKQLHCFHVDFMCFSIETNECLKNKRADKSWITKEVVEAKEKLLIYYAIKKHSPTEEILKCIVITN